MKKYLKNSLNNIVDWYKYSTRTRVDRLQFVILIGFISVMLLCVIPLIISLWKVFVFLFAALIGFAVVTSPITIWVLRGKRND